MNAFKNNLTIEERSTAILRPFFENRGWTFGEHYPPFDPRGDYPVTRGDTALNFEFKAEQHEQSKPSTLFIEFLSNAETGRLGWFYTLQTDKLIYHFLDTERVHVIDFSELRKYEVWKHRQVEQSHSEQNNTTLGWSVPVEVLEAIGVAQSFELNTNTEKK